LRRNVTFLENTADWRRENRIEAYTEMVAFLDKHV
jgi:hypothetical protein